MKSVDDCRGSSLYVCVPFLALFSSVSSSTGRMQHCESNTLLCRGISLPPSLEPVCACVRRRLSAQRVYVQDGGVVYSPPDTVDARVAFLERARVARRAQTTQLSVDWPGRARRRCDARVAFFGARVRSSQQHCSRAAACLHAASSLDLLRGNSQRCTQAALRRLAHAAR